MKESFGKLTIVALLTPLVGACAPNISRQVSSADQRTLQEGSYASPPGHEAPINTGATRRQAPGLVVYIDPVTGEILPKPQPAPGDPNLLQPMFQTAPAPTQQPVEVYGAEPGSGVKVRLNRQFHQPLVATTDSGGKIKLEHRPAQSDSEAR
jgi:hypothetical protein